MLIHTRLNRWPPTQKMTLLIYQRQFHHTRRSSVFYFLFSLYEYLFLGRSMFVNAYFWVVELITSHQSAVNQATIKFLSFSSIHSKVDLVTESQHARFIVYSMKRKHIKMYHLNFYFNLNFVLYFTAFNVNFLKKLIFHSLFPVFFISLIVQRQICFVVYIGFTSIDFYSLEFKSYSLCGYLINSFRPAGWIFLFWVLEIAF